MYRNLILFIFALTFSKILTQDQQCGENETYNECGTACEPTCDNRYPICMTVCKEGCNCNAGFVRQNGKCIPESECSSNNKDCPPNEYIKPCSGCEPSCDNPHPICIKMCKQLNICECVEGKFRNNATGECVDASECPVGSPAINDTKQCGENEELRSCPGCESKCDMPDPRICPLMCRIGQECECKSGFSRNSEGKCVPRSECSNAGNGPLLPRDTNQTCGENEHEVECSGCEAQCDNLNRICPMMCNGIKACECQSGFARDSSGKCVPTDQCNNGGNPHQCKKNEDWLEACGACEGTCDNPEPQFCTLDCKPAGCYCVKKGFVRGPKGRCIHKSLCQRIRNDTNEPTNPCAAKTCPIGTVCQQQIVQCFMPPCPPLAECVPINSPSQGPPPNIRNPFCERARCGNGPCLAVGIKCKSLTDCEYIGECVDKNANPADYDVCENSTCPIRSTCEAQVVQCFAPPCLNIPRCVRTPRIARDGCAALNCPENQECVTALINCIRAPCPPIARCIDKRSTPEVNPCSFTTCPFGKVCKAKQVQCIRAPCPPIAECVDPSEAENESLIKTRDTNGFLEDPEVACSRVRCPEGTRCRYLAINCLRAPCPGSMPRCIPINNADNSNTDNTDNLNIRKTRDTNSSEDPCKTAICKKGYDCRTAQIFGCKKPPCLVARCYGPFGTQAYPENEKH